MHMSFYNIFKENFIVCREKYKQEVLAMESNMSRWGKPVRGEREIKTKRRQRCSKKRAPCCPWKAERATLDVGFPNSLSTPERLMFTMLPFLEDQQPNSN